MSYQVLARKWRPRNFSQLAGQEHVVQALSNALTQKRLHHAYLLTGTRGVGKTTIARILAKSLNCETGITATPCGVCSACTAVDEGRFVDLIELDAASSTGIDNMREILDTARYAPTVGRYKVYLIDEVHMLSKSAFNSMLKTLEEPPEHVKFVLATTDPQKIPITVLSRCLQFNLKQLPPPVVAKQLEHVLTEEGIAFEAGAIRVLSRAAQGSMRDGLSLLDQAIAYGGGTDGVQEAPVRAMLGAVETDYVLRLLEALAVRDGPMLVAEARAMAERNIALDAALQELGVALHDVALLQTVPEAIADDHPDRERLADLARKLDPEIVQLYYQIAVQGRADLPLAPDEFAGFSMTLLRMLAFTPVETMESSGAASTPASAATRGGSAPTPRAAPTTGTTSTPRPASAPAAAPTPRSAPTPGTALTSRAASTSSTSPTTASRPDAKSAAAVASDLIAAVASAAVASAAQVASQSNASVRNVAPAGDAPNSASKSTSQNTSTSAPTTVSSSASSNTSGGTPSTTSPSTSPERIEDANRRLDDWFSWVAASGLTGLAHQLAYNLELSDHRATPTGIELVLALPETQRHLAEKMHQDKLKDSLAQTLGVPVRLTIQMGGAGESSAAASDRRARAKAQEDAAAGFNADPFVRDAVRLFDGRVRPQTIQPVSGPAASKGTRR